MNTPISDELSFWREVVRHVGWLDDARRHGERMVPRDLINSPVCIVHHKRCWRWLEKWADRGLYDYGVTLDLGWLTDSAKRLDDPRKWRERR